MLIVGFAQSHQKRTQRLASPRKERATAREILPGSGSDEMYIAKSLITSAM
jgi:hypothetical protein